MAKIQLNIADSVNDEILEKLVRRTDKALFIEIAVKKAYQDKEIRDLFSWVDDTSNVEPKPRKTKLSTTKTETAPKEKNPPKFDPEFS